MNSDKLSILHFLAMRRADVALATDVMSACCLTHEEAYTHLVALEAAGLVRVFIGAHWLPSGPTGRQGWELTDEGRAFVEMKEAA